MATRYASSENFTDQNSMPETTVLAGNDNISEPPMPWLTPKLKNLMIVGYISSVRSF